MYEVIRGFLLRRQVLRYILNPLPELRGALVECGARRLDKLLGGLLVRSQILRQVVRASSHPNTGDSTTAKHTSCHADPIGINTLTKWRERLV